MKTYSYFINLYVDPYDDCCNDRVEIISTKEIPLQIFLDMIKVVIKQLKEEGDDEYIFPEYIAEKLIKNNPYYFQAPDIDNTCVHTIEITGEERNELAIYSNKEWVTTYNVKE